MKVYTIVEFADGIEMEPTIWLSKDTKKCAWPPYKNQIKINEAIAKIEDPEKIDPGEK